MHTAEEEPDQQKHKKSKKHKKDKDKKEKREDEEKQLLKAAKKFLKQVSVHLTLDIAGPRVTADAKPHLHPAVQKLKGEGKEEAGAAAEDNTPLAKDVQIDALTDDDYFRKNAEACPMLLHPLHPFFSAQQACYLAQAWCADCMSLLHDSTPVACSCSSASGCALSGDSSSTSSAVMRRASCSASLQRPGTPASSPRASTWALRTLPCAAPSTPGASEVSWVH